jgi:hypothetical protein
MIYSLFEKPLGSPKKCSITAISPIRDLSVQNKLANVHNTVMKRSNEVSEPAVSRIGEIAHHHMSYSV